MSTGDAGAMWREEDVRILDDSAVTERPYRIGEEFWLYDDGVSVKFKVTEIVEHEGRRITYGVPAELLTGG